MKLAEGRTIYFLRLKALVGSPSPSGCLHTHTSTSNMNWIWHLIKKKYMHLGGGCVGCITSWRAKMGFDITTVCAQL